MLQQQQQQYQYQQQKSEFECRKSATGLHVHNQSLAVRKESPRIIAQDEMLKVAVSMRRSVGL